MSVGTVITANCNCKAGLGSTCTHVASLLFYIETAVRIRDAKTVTQEKAYWLLPGSVKDVTPSPVADIDFSSAKTRRNRLSQAIDSLGDAANLTTTTTTTPPLLRHSREIPKATDAEQQSFLASLKSTGRKCAILTISAPHNVDFVPKVTLSTFPKPLSSLKSENCLEMDHKALTEHCQRINVAITKPEADVIEKATKTQAKSKLWYRYRAGRITASRMKAACSTSASKPSLSLIKAICYPEATTFKTAATEWGCNHEKSAREDYIAIMNQHDSFICQDSGLVLSPTFPYLGATPDGVVSCKCCGVGVLEIKCPYCVAAPSDHTCLESRDGQDRLKKTHAYFYQVQTQLFLCDVEYADFVLWVNGKIHLERITPDIDFWEKVHPKAHEFFQKVILLELSGQFFTRIPSATTPVSITAPKRPLCLIPDPAVCATLTQPTDTQPLVPKWCLYRGEEKLPMIGCDSTNCETTWFHFECVGITVAPKGSWYCDKCQQHVPSQNKQKY
nr:uncharacterized protein LOC117447530 [Pseudochaenichthys georgianus]